MSYSIVTVWRSNHSAVEAVINAHPYVDTSVKETLKTAPPSPVTLDGEFVAALSPNEHWAAEMYSALTGRRLLGTPTVSGSPLAGCGLYVGLLSDATPALIEHAAFHGQGLILAADARKLEQKLVASAAALACSGRGRRTYRSIDVFVDEEVLQGAPYLEVGGRASGAIVKELVSVESGILHIRTGCDGADAKLPGGLVLCSQLTASDADSPASTDRSPTCAQDGYCYRTGHLVEKAKGDGLLIGASELRANILLLDACNILQSAEGFYEPSSLLVNDIGLSGAPIALAHFDITQSSRGLLASLIGALLSGERVGEAARRFNASHAAAGFGKALCVLGDPQYQLTVSDECASSRAWGRTADWWNAQTRRRAIALTGLSGGGAFWRRCLQYAAAHHQCSETHSEARARLSAQLDNWIDQPDATMSAPDILHAFSDREFFLLWWGWAPLYVAPKLRCVCCSYEARSRVAHTPGGIRRIMICPSCGSALDLAEKPLIRAFTLLDGRAVVSLEDDEADQQVCLRVAPPQAQAGRARLVQVQGDFYDLAAQTAASPSQNGYILHFGGLTRQQREITVDLRGLSWRPNIMHFYATDGRRLDYAILPLRHQSGLTAPKKSHPSFPAYTIMPNRRASSLERQCLL